MASSEVGKGFRSGGRRETAPRRLGAGYHCVFIDLHGHTPGQDPVPPEVALAGLLTAVGVDARYLPEDLGGRTNLWRDRMAGQQALLVLDNAASSAQIAPLLPGGDDCLVLVTSRRHLAGLDRDGDVVEKKKARYLFQSCTHYANSTRIWPD